MKFRYLCILLVLLALMLPYFALSQTSGWDNLQTTTTFGFGSQKFNSQLASAFKVQVPFPIYIQGKITTVLAPWWLLVLVFMIVYPILDIIFGIVPPFSKARERGLSGVETSKTVFTIGFTLLAMFVTPLVPSVVELVAFGTTAGIFWFWMLVIVIIVWGTNWLFGESAFGDPFRKGAAGLGHMGSAGMSKFKKHFREEMNDTTNEAKYLTDLDALMNQNIQKNQKERDLIENLRQLLHLLVQARNVNSSAARPILEKMRTRLLELKSFIESEDNLNKRISGLANLLATVNNKANKITSSFATLKSQIENLLDQFIKANPTNKASIKSQYNGTNSHLKDSFPSYLARLEKEIQTDDVIDSKQAEIADKITKLNDFLRNNSTRQELGIINSMVSDIDEILLWRVSQSKANKFIQLAGSFIWNLQQIEKNNFQIEQDCIKMWKSCVAFYKRESIATNSLTEQIKLLDTAYNYVMKNGSF